jgi:hypothetical protein
LDSSKEEHTFIFETVVAEKDLISLRIKKLAQITEFYNCRIINAIYHYYFDINFTVRLLCSSISQ